MIRPFALLSVLVLFLASMASAQYIMMPDSTNNRIVLFDPNTGALVNSNFFGLAAGTPIHAMQVGSEIWVSEQIGDRISRWDMSGASLGSISGGIDNVRGMALINNTVYLASTGTANGAPGRSVHMYNTSGGSLGFFATAPSSGFGLLHHNGELLVSSDAANDDIHRYGLLGGSLGTFHNSTGLNFAEQMDYTVNGDIWVAAFSSNLVARLDPNTGAILSTFSAPGARGVYQLGNGNVMWTSGAGAFVHDVNTGSNTSVYAGGGRFLDFVNIPAPGGLALLGAAGLFANRRRRS